jgi:hypothetical protein
MEFIKKHWSRLSIALLFLVGGILAIVFYAADGMFDFTGKETSEVIGAIVPFVSALLFFFGMTAVMLMKIYLPKYVGIIYGIVGGVITLAYVILICIYPIKTDSNNFWIVIVPLIAFGLYPLLKGVTKFVESENWKPKIETAKVTATKTETVKTATEAK